MSRKTKWKKADVKRAIETIAQELAQAFNVPLPVVFIPDHLTANEWEYRFETVQVWTKAGAAELNIRIDDHFAHMYFRFDDPKRAATIARGFNRLNPHSGKWNSLESAPHELRFWVDELKHDFAKVAEPSPDAQEVDEYQSRKADESAKWEQYRIEFAEQLAAKNGSNEIQESL